MFYRVIFFEHGLLSIGKNVQTHSLFILTNSFSADWGIKSGLGQKLASFELAHINRIAMLYGVTFSKHT
jgi:hypothetical protein